MRKYSSVVSYDARVSRDLLLLMRAPLAASAVANLGVGIALAFPSGRGWALADLWPVLLLVCATSVLYWGGMVLNDYFDRERDRELYPERPLPSGRVEVSLARALGFGFLAAGVGLAAGAGLLAGGGWQGAAGGAAVAACVLAYDGWLKRYRLLGSIAMGSCRVSNALMGGLAFGLLTPAATLPLVYAGLLGLYVSALTWLSTYEDEDAPALALYLGHAALVAAPLGVVALIVLQPGWNLAGLVGVALLAAVCVRQLVLAAREGTQARGGAATRALLKAIWLLDLGVLLATERWILCGVLAALWLVGSYGAKRLFRPPQPAANMGDDG